MYSETFYKWVFNNYSKGFAHGTVTDAHYAMMIESGVKFWRTQAAYISAQALQILSDVHRKLSTITIDDDYIPDGIIFSRDGTPQLNEVGKLLLEFAVV